MKLLLAASTLLAALALACDDGDDPATTPAPEQILELRGFNITVINFREAVLDTYILRDPAFCAAIDGMTPEEAIERLNQELGEGTPSGVPLPNSTPVAEEAQRSRDDELAAARITLDECDAAAGAIPTPTATPGAAIPSGT